MRRLDAFVFNGLTAVNASRAGWHSLRHRKSPRRVSGEDYCNGAFDTLISICPRLALNGTIKVRKSGAVDRTMLSTKRSGPALSACASSCPDKK